MNSAPTNPVFFEKFLDHLPDMFERPAPGTDLVATLQYLADQCLPGLIGLKFEALTPEESVAHIDYRKETTGLHGLMHGGTIFSAGDTLTAMMSLLLGDENSRNVLTTDATIRYLRPVAEGRVRLVAKVHRREGNRVYFVCDYFNEDGKRVARSRYTYLIVE